jgi:hypothetical protein
MENPRSTVIVLAVGSDSNDRHRIAEVARSRQRASIAGGLRSLTAAF